MRKPRRVPGNGPVVAAASVVGLLSLIPLGFIIWIAIDVGWDKVVELTIRPKVGELLLNTLVLEALTLPLCIVLGVTLAWLTERTDLPGARWWSALSVAPLAVPAFVQGYAWDSFAPSFHGLPGAVLLSILAYLPFVYLPVAAQLRRLDPSLEDSAAALGQPPTAVFFRVILPQLRLPIGAGGVLVGLHLLGEYGLFVLMRYDTFATAIVDQFQAVYNGPAANLLGGVLVLCCVVLLGLEALVRGDRRYARVGAGAARKPALQQLGRWTFPAITLFVVMAALSLGVVLMTLSRWLIIGGAEIWKIDQIGTAFTQTLILAVAGAALTTFIAVPAAWLAVRAPGKFQRVIEAAHTYVGALPGIIVALALVTITVRIALPLYQTMATLLFAYALMFLPRALTGLRSSIAQAPPELERAAMTLGRGPLTAIRQTTLRLAAPGIAASMALVALGIANELTGTLMLAPNGTRTLAMRFWSLTSELDYAAAAPYALLMILLSLPLTYLLRVQADRIAGR